MDDRDLIDRITLLVAEEQQLQETDHHDAARLRDVEVMLDQCWDLLRQRRARRHAGKDPAEAQVRSEEVVEHYQQ